MIKTLVEKVIGTKHDREMKRMQPLVARVGEFERRFESLSDEELAAKTIEFRTRIDNGESVDALMPEAFGVCRVASVRALGMRHYDVQIIGGSILHRGSIAEMKTGEGKTLTATLSMYLNALSGKGAHLVTVNDYLASRDAEWMGQLYGFLGLKTGVIISDLSTAQRREAYLSDITYGTNNEFGFDYLRDNMKYALTDKVQRPLHYAIVDEVDSILIDEARTPLIISGQAELVQEVYYRVNQVVVELKRDQDYIVDEEHRSATLTEEGIDGVEQRLNIDNLFEPTNIDLLHHVGKALEAHTLYKKGEQYLIQEGKIVIVDEFTGRAMPGRRWSDGLHQAIEAKEGVEIKNESVTLATITYQNYFRMYDKLSGMTGTADTEAEEFGKIYDLNVHVIPTNEPCIRLDQADVVYRTEREKFSAIVDQILECYEKGQPVLIGTVSVDKSEVISKVLKKKKISHSVLNAKFHGQEAGIVAQAGRKGGITIATNMAGRGTDILLGGNPEALAEKVAPDTESEEFTKAHARFMEVCAREKQEVLDAGGLFILGTERHDSRRIDNQLRGRAGRQGDPGESRFFLSLEDDLMRRFGADRIQGLMLRLGMEDGVPIEHGMVSKSIENAQKRVEGRNFDVRKHLLEYDDVMNVQRAAIYGLREEILAGDHMQDLVLDVLDDTLGALLDLYANPAVRVDEWDLDALARELKEHFDIDVQSSELAPNRDELEKTLWARVSEHLQEKIDALEYIAEKYNERYAEAADFEPKTKELVFRDLARQTYLRELDKSWREHLTAMQSLRDSVSLHGYAQKDPKHIYKKEGYDLFAMLRSTINGNVSRLVMRIVVKTEESVADSSNLAGKNVIRFTGPGAGQAQPSPQGRRRVTMSGKSTAQADGSSGARPQLPKLGRNEPCWCGSGKKYKRCHMRIDTQKADEMAAGDKKPEEKPAAPAAAASVDEPEAEKKKGVSII